MTQKRDLRVRQTAPNDVKMLRFTRNSLPEITVLEIYLPSSDGHLCSRKKMAQFPPNGRRETALHHLTWSHFQNWHVTHQLCKYTGNSPKPGVINSYENGLDTNCLGCYRFDPLKMTELWSSSPGFRSGLVTEDWRIQLDLKNQWESRFYQKEDLVAAGIKARRSLASSHFLA